LSRRGFPKRGIVASRPAPSNGTVCGTGSLRALGLALGARLAFSPKRRGNRICPSPNRGDPWAMTRTLSRSTCPRCEKYKNAGRLVAITLSNLLDPVGSYLVRKHRGSSGDPLRHRGGCPRPHRWVRVLRIRKQKVLRPLINRRFGEEFSTKTGHAYPENIDILAVKQTIAVRKDDGSVLLWGVNRSIGSVMVTPVTQA
jgi:hypothetical protein